MCNVLVTGADGSLGRVLCDRFNARGDTVFKLHRGVATSKPDIELALEQEIKHYPIDVVVLNDGTNRLSWIGTTPAADAAVIERNLLAPYWVLNWLVDRQQRPARVLFVASQTYRVPQRTTALYCASKAGMVQMAKVAARELAPHGWIINVLAPGKIEDTRMSKLTDAQVNELRGWSPMEADDYARKLIPAGRYTNTAEVADAVLWALDAPAYVNGAVLEVMGGV